MSILRKTSPQKPLLQEEAWQYINAHPEVVFEVEKIRIPVQLTKALKGTKVRTVTLARDGRRIKETENVAQEGYGIDTRICIDGSIDQYAKKPARVVKDYTIDSGEAFDNVAQGETVLSHTKGLDIRKAFVAEEDLYLATTWGQVQFVAKGGIVTFMGKEAIGNNNPCDMVLHTTQANGDVVLTCPVDEIKKDAKQKKLILTQGVRRFFAVARTQDIKNPYLSKCYEIFVGMKNGVQFVQQKFEKLVNRRACRPKAPKRTLKLKKKTNSR